MSTSNSKDPFCDEPNTIKWEKLCSYLVINRFKAITFEELSIAISHI